ncbi:MAG: methyltransferase, partial [Brooklawnia sp.]
RIEQRDFRLWVPITRADLVAMVSTQPGVAILDEPARRSIVHEASQIFDSATRMSELRLPYQLQCWRAHVDHHELTQPITFSDGALVIPL